MALEGLGEVSHTRWKVFYTTVAVLVVSMILPQVHLRKPCYDFSFLEMFRFKQLRASRSAVCTASQAPSENFIGTFIGRSDGRCVQRAGTYSMRVDDSRLQGIPRCMTNNCKSQSLARREFKRLAKGPLGSADMLVARVSVARVRPRTSKGITALLLPQTSLAYNVR